MTESRNILVADDDALARDFLVEFLTSCGHRVAAVADADEAWARLERGSFDLLVTDLRMPGDDGLALLRRVRASGRALPVVVVTAYGSVGTAVRALKEGAHDFLTKPLAPEQIEEVLENLFRPAEEPAEARSEDGGVGEERLLARNPRMVELVETAVRVARSRATVLITGESGTGKELVARLIHERSPRARGPYVRVNCAALAETLLESELFGHERGAFTGALSRRAGRFELAHGGTLFLDEIGETSPALQAKLLRVLEEREFERVGGTKTLRVDVRCVAATNRDLKREIEEGRFREDLYYRLRVVHLRIPPLRERREDIEPLARHFLAKFARENGSRVRDLSPRAIEALRTHSWPGNVRELENTIERAVVLDAAEVLEPEHLELGGTGRDAQIDVSAQVGHSLEDVERALILRTLESTGNSRKEAARILGVTPRTLTNKIAKYRRLGIEVGPPVRRRQKAAGPAAGEV